ncbi:MAG: RnfABCDGE type electron transport complex subunit D [bacterium]
MNYLISPGPHIKAKDSIPQLMNLVLIALLPAVAAGVYFFGLPALFLMLVCTIAAVVTEIICLKIMKSKTPAKGGGAILTGLLLAMCLPPNFPLWAGALGSVVAIVIGKQLFGGLGYNIFNPALVGRAFLAAAFPVFITTWTSPFAAITSATPLAVSKFQHLITEPMSLLIGNVGGCVGETSALLLLLGGLFLLWKGVIDWRIPVSYLASVFILGGFFWILNPQQYPDPIFHLLAGGLMLGAWFMATDYVTSPITKKGMLYFGAGAGVLVVIIRLFSGLPEGVMYSILLMNAFVPLINRYTRPRILGRVK